MSLLIAYSAGCLIAEAIFHSLPHLLQGHDDHHHQHGILTPVSSHHIDQSGSHHDCGHDDHHHGDYLEHGTDYYGNDHHRHKHEHSHTHTDRSPHGHGHGHDTPVSLYYLVAGILFCFFIQRTIDVISAYFEDVTRQSPVEDEPIDVKALCDDNHYAGSEGKEIKLKSDEKREKEKNNKSPTKRNSPSRSRSVSKNTKRNIIDDEISTDTTKRRSRGFKTVPNDNDQPSQENLKNISKTTKLTNIISKPSPKLHPEVPQIPKVQHSITFMSIFSDFLHNFGDGMNIAIAYTASTNSKSVGTSMALMITLHEVIRAVSDLSILMTHGNFSLLEACKMQLMTASGAVLGCFVGTLPMWISMMMEVSGGDQPKGAWGEGMLEVISPLSLGCFLYLSMQLLASLNGGEASGHGHGHSHGGFEPHQGNESKGGCKSAVVVTPFEKLKNGFLLLFVDLSMVVFGILSTQVVGMFE